jgi:exodeoxyribonuclease VII large subunit
MQTYALSQVLTIVDQWFKAVFAEFDFWCTAETSKVTTIKNNTYLELIETDATNKIVAKAKWIIRWQDILRHFLVQTKLSPRELTGITLLLHGRCSFHQEYGFSIVIDELSAEYTLGQMQKKQNDILLQLQKEWIATKNKEKNLGYPPYSIAVISSEKSQGLRDFLTVLDSSQYNLDIQTYYAAIHGNEAKEAVYEQLQTIFKDIRNGKKIDMIAILRGGGESSGILRQNDENIARWICLMTVPVCVAIGHTSDTSVLDHIARFVAKTPTDAAYILIQHMDRRHEQLQSLHENIRTVAQNKVVTIQHNLERIHENIQKTVQRKFEVLAKNVQHRYTGINNLTPKKLHTLGYATLHDPQGKYLGYKQISWLHVNDQITLKVYDQTLTVRIEKKI